MLVLLRASVFMNVKSVITTDVGVNRQRKYHKKQEAELNPRLLVQLHLHLEVSLWELIIMGLVLLHNILR